MMNTITSTQALAPSITKAASKQTYYTIRFLADRKRVADAYRAYAYFRWVDDTLDAVPNFARSDAGQDAPSEPEVQERINFLDRQKSLLEKCYRGESLQDATSEENMLIELVQRDREKNSGLQSYLRNMMQVMGFDAKRRGRLISQAELNEYTRWLATAVTEAMHYFIGHGCYAPHNETRYFAVTGAHITHMLRDTYDDVQAGYYNIPREVLEANHIEPFGIHSKAYRAWVQSRVQLARQYFKAGREYLAQVEEPRCRLAGFAYAARFEWLLDTIDQEDYSLRPEYTERKSFGTGLQMGLLTLSSLFHVRQRELLPPPVASHSLRKL
ncbi:MAG TPA: squalene/phytoene synthase family protein [Anaerolineales bacterium]|nr:squalene/phytoene synthase family protein [Anaerolineales bacterium]